MFKNILFMLKYKIDNCFNNHAQEIGALWRANNILKQKIKALEKQNSEYLLNFQSDILKELNRIKKCQKK